ncbi:pilus assembly protein [Acidovorax sp.]|uniref:pilus assembly protein n=1 Tax=Acidovorax sp. TaxID=1872122 RepID=UPI00391FAD71
MPRTTRTRTHFKKNLIAMAVGAALAPHASWALDFAQSPPGTKESFVAPNIILSLDDSGSMILRDMFGGTKTRYQVLKETLIDVFSDTNLLPDGKIRFAWQAMNNCTAGAIDLGTGAATATSNNVMRRLNPTHRSNFISYMNNFSVCGATPTHKMTDHADQYMRAPLHKNGPWASVPGTTSAPYLGCRRNFHILFTDGGWNTGQRSTSPPNFDNQNTTLPDGTSYSNLNANTRVYRDTENTSTIADWAFRSWSSPLQSSGLTGAPIPRSDYNTAPATETFKNRVTNVTTTIDKYWNPRHNPATWPHMVTYTIGFSGDALPQNNYNDAGDHQGAITTPSSMLPYEYDGSFAEYANGAYAWKAASKDRGHDMWHAALNGRGRFYAVEKGEDLAEAFRSIIDDISYSTEPGLGSTATSGSNSSRNDIAKYIAGYVPADAWKGYVNAETVKPDGTTVPAAGWSGQSTADKLDATGFNVDARVVLSYSIQIVNSVTGQEKGGVPFKWATDETNLSTAQKAFLNLNNEGSSDSLGQDRLNYIRGDRTKEGGGNPFRQRKSRQGDIVNSEVWYTGAPSSNYAWKGYAAFTAANKTRLPMIYVGGNDGMLHGFSGTDGTEKLAYVPKGVIPAVGRLADVDYDENHRYYVDGSAMSGDVDVNGGVDVGEPGYSTYVPDWRTMLVGTLGAGGKGYFVLNITNPSNFTEANAQNIVVMDKTRHASESVATVAACEDVTITPVANKEACLAAADMGHIFAKPVLDENNPQRTSQIARLNNNRWAAVMGNGYNSKSERPVLLVQYLDGDRKLLRLVATGTTATGSSANTTENGLSAPRLLDINGDGRPDVAYAGDLKGNMWKFLIADSNDSNWGVALWGSAANTTTNHTTNGVPLFSAKGGTETSPNSRTLPQPITVAPIVRANDRKKQVTESGVTKMVNVTGVMVAFGTGRNITNDDPQNTNKQTLYSVLDNTSYKLIGVKKDRVAVCTDTLDADCKALLKTADDLPKSVIQANLVSRNVSSTSVFSRSGHKFWTIDASTTLNWSTNQGWFMDLPESRERLLKPLEFYDSGNILSAFSQIPTRSALDASTESCDVASVIKGSQFWSLINIMDGKRPSVQIMDTNGDGKYVLTSDKEASRVSVAAGSHTLVRRGNKIRLTGKKQDGSDEHLDNATLPEQSLRPSWRQLR